MTSSKPGLRLKQIFQWLGAASSLLFAFACLLPAKPQAFDAIDDSWMEALHSAFLHHLQFGRDIIYTYGPWGFLFGGYRPETHLLSSLLWLALGVVFWAAGRRLARVSFRNEVARWLWLMAVTALTAVAVFPNTDARLMCFPLFLIALYFFDETASAKFIQGAVIVALGLLSLVKFTVFIISLVVIAAMVVQTVWKRRRFPWGAALYAGSVLLFWLLAGQHLSSFGSYFRNSLQVTSGYTEAMAGNNAGESAYLCGFVLVALLSLGMATFASWKRLRYFGLLPLGAFGFIIFVVFKHGFVRDDIHEAMASVLLLLVSLVCWAIFWPLLPERRWWLRTAAGLPVAATCVFAAFSFHRFAESPPLTRLLAGTLSPGKWAAPVRLLYDGKGWKEAREKYLANYRETYALPPLKGSVDVYSWNLLPIFAYGLNYQPRPMLQSFSAFTPRLAGLDAAHLRSDSAADTIVFNGDTMDRRYVTMDDGLSWPELLTRYDVQEVEAPFLILNRAPKPREFHLTLLQEATMRFGEPLALPPNSDPLWAEIEIDHTLGGSLGSAVFKPPTLAINTTLRNGQQRANRFIPEMAKSGFILSPYVSDCLSFAALASGHAATEPAGDEVAAFNISVLNGAASGDYKNSIRVRLYRLDYPKQDLENVAGYRHINQLKEALHHVALTGPGQLLYLRDAGSVLATPIGTAVLLDRPKNARQLKVGFGLHLREGTQNQSGLTFIVCGLDAQQQVIPLWNRHLDPHGTPGDQGNQEATVELGNSATPRLLLGAMPDPGGTNEVLCPYWSEMHFE